MKKVQKNGVYTFLVMAFITCIGLVIVLTIFNSAKQEQIKQSQELLLQDATSHYKTIKALEIWHNKFGGVFKKVADPDSYHFDIYSLRPKNKENQAVGFVKDALIYFGDHPDDIRYYKFFNNDQDFNFVGVLRTEERCVQCHTNFKVGEVRGGIKINIPLIEYRKSLFTINDDFKTFYILVIFFFIAVLIGLYFFIKNIYSHREKIEELNASLEKKVTERTREVRVLYSREHYLKNLLETISELNETLIESYSLGSIIETSLNTLHHHPSYKLILFGHFDGKRFHTRYISGDIYNVLSKKEEYSFEELEKHDFLKSIHDTVQTRHWSLDNKSEFKLPQHTTKRDSDYSLYSSISFPMIESEDDYEYDILTFWTSNENGFDAEEISLLDGATHDITMSLSIFKQRKLTEKLQQEQLNNYEETILAFVDMIEQRDAYTAGHTLRVAKYSRLMAKELHIDEQLIKKIEKAAILHDIGKIATPDTILLKPGKLTPLEYKLIQNHVTAGYKMLSKVKMYSQLAEIMKFHHEHYDGTGYPYGYKGDEIPIEAHIMIVADAFDAMTTNRIYKGRKTIEDAIDELVKGSGTQFHPKVVEVAKVVLADINIAKTTQMPQSELEKQRFSYFFNDSLTGVYNDSYLQLIINQIDTKTYINIIKLQHFTQYNKAHSWHEGNEVLVGIANQLKENFPNSKIFRYQGDDFVIVSSENKQYNQWMLNIKQQDPQNIIHIKADFFEVNNIHDIDKIPFMNDLVSYKI